MSTDLHPANRRTHALPAAAFLDISCSSPPDFVNDDPITICIDSIFELVHPELDKEIRANIIILDTSVKPKRRLGSHYF